MMELTKEEKAWVRKVNALLAKCPSDRLGFYTSGDHSVSVYDNTKDDAISGFMSINSNSDFGYATEQCGALAVQTIKFPSNVHSVAG